MTTTLQTNRPAAPVPAPAPEGIEWATPPVKAPADGRLDPSPAREASATGQRLSPFAAVAAMRRSMSARRARRIANRPELESIFPVGHPGFELLSERTPSRPVLVASTAASAAAAADAVDLDFAF